MFSKILEEKYRKFKESRPPVPRKPIRGIPEDSLSKKLRALDNEKITHPQSLTAQVYINTNETQVRESLERLREIPKIALGCHIGFSGWHNFDIIAQRKSSRAVICDLNPENALFLHHILEILRECRDRHEFADKAAAYIKSSQYPLCLSLEAESVHFEVNLSEDKIYDDVLEPHEEVALELERELGWLSSEENFLYLQELARGDKIALISENIIATETFYKVYNLLEANGIQIDTVYTSNISSYLEEDKEQKAFIQTISKLLADRETILIDAPQNTQRITLSRELKDKDLEDWFFETQNKHRPLLRTEDPKPSPESIHRENRRDNLWCTFFQPALIGVGAAAATLYFMSSSETP